MGPPSQPPEGSYPGLLADGLWVLGNSYFSLYLVRGKTASALVDTGISAIADEVIHQLKTIGVSPDYIIVTHPHGDHINGLEALRAHCPEARVIIGPGAREFLAHPKTAAALVAEDRFMSEFLASQGYRTERPPIQSPPSVDGAMVVNEGETLDLGGLSIRFLHVGGHAIGNILVHVPDCHALMASDSLGFRIPSIGFFPIFFTGYADYMATIDRLETLEPRILCLAHQGPLVGEDARRAFKEAREAARSLYDQIRNDPREENALIADLNRHFYREELSLYTPDNIIGCCRLIIRRSRA
ncbi:MAG TPA: MBL fold metallo-hydrolase [Syntrophales bacterium]|nr:MBL fold metallo-hydrolase [Syntrophales bacterium]